ncbi:protein TIFY 5A-like [Primulina huaijiensis]|uniref:protein TIFY 5A-like n=1 Tax=Primulina huaijiensis TaxID=1492673 RepID=UPI003CC745C1
MKRNCNLELRFVAPRPVIFSNCINYGGPQTPNPIHKELTIFYNGEVSVSDVTELQARAIILLASRETEEKSPGSNLNPPLCSPTTGLYMKRSLQRFLQKRKIRSQETSPYPLNFSGHPNN